MSAGVATLSHAQPQLPPSYDFDFATIGAIGNAPYLGDPGTYPPLQGRGSVPYEYRISRMEVTTSQWMEFVNHYSTLGGEWTYFGMPTFWGADLDPSYTGPGWKWMLDPSIPQAERLPVGGISWRTAAMYCNWLHNDKSPTVAALQNGAYDASTFQTLPDQTFTDQHTRHPGAKYWIPSLDEWIKAVHYDPNRYGMGEEGWWLFSYKSDSPPIPGPPGVGQTSAGEFERFWEVPLGAYADMQSPWGLWDTSGGVTELTEEVGYVGWPVVRFSKGSAFGGAYASKEAIWGYYNSLPSSSVSFQGLRIASAVPSPGATVLIVIACSFIGRRGR